jgi:hypothetical protein
MLGELTELQQPSDETIQRIDMNFEVRTRDSEANELVEKVYTFCYAKEWDKWTFQEYVERRSPDTTRMSDRDWRRVQHCLWHDVNETPDIDVPPQVADKLAKATGSESVTIQVPRGPIGDTTYETVTEATGD